MAFQKLKSFGRRKSTGNALDEPVLDLPDLSPGESSFKVIPRHERQNVISFDKPSVGDNRHSNASSAQTRPGPETAASSLRYSSTSTNPSSVELDGRSSPLNPSHFQRNGQKSPELLSKTCPNTPQQRTGSFKSWKLLPATPSGTANSRDRALTTSSYASTAVPPKLEQPIPALGDNAFDDLEDLFAGLGGFGSSSVADGLLPQAPQRTFQRADSEPIVTPRNPLGSSSPLVGSTPALVRVNGDSNVDPPQPSPDLDRKSTDRLMFPNSSEPPSPALSSSVQGHAAGTNGVASHINPFADKPSNGLPKPSSRGSDTSQTFNTSALAYTGDNSDQGVRRMSQKQYETLKQRERYEAKMRLTRGESTKEEDDDDEGPTIYEDLDDDEDERRREKRKREKQQADLAVNRQQMRKLIGRENTDPSLNTPRRLSTPQINVGAEPKNPHLLPYAHHLPPVTPPEPNRLTASSNNSATSLHQGKPPMHSGRSSGDEDDEDVPLGILQPHIMQKNAEMNRRMSMAGSLVNGSASITPQHLLGASPNRSSAWLAPPDSRPKSRTSNAAHLPAFAQRLPPPEQLPLIPGFQGTNGGSGYFAQPPMDAVSMYGGMGPPTPGTVMYQDGFTGPYQAVGQQGATFMDTIQHEERRKKTKYKPSPQQQAQRASTMPNMQGFDVQPPSMPPMAMMNPMMQQQMAMMQQMQVLQQQIAMMSGMNPNMMGMGMDPVQMQQMQMQQMNMNGGGLPNGQRRMSMHGNGMRSASATFLGSLPAIPDASPTPGSALPILNGGLPPGYAPSIAPSERSNVGMPSRYKPVTMASDSASVMGDRPRSSLGPRPISSAMGANSIRATLRPVGGSPAPPEDDGEADGSGWGKLRARRSKNKPSIAV